MSMHRITLLLLLILTGLPVVVFSETGVNSEASADEQAPAEAGQTEISYPETDSVPTPIAEPAEPTPGEENNAPEEIEKFIQHIAQLEVEYGAYDPSMAEGLFSLGKTYQQLDMHPQAVDAFKQSAHIFKINNGLYDLALEPVLRELIASSEAMGDRETAALGLDTLYLINEKTYGPDDPRMIPILDELTQWHLNAYQRGQDELPHLIASNQLSRNAITLTETHYGASDLRLVNLLKIYALSNYHMALYLQQHKELPEKPDFYFTTGPRDPFENNLDEWRMLGNSYRDGKEAYEHMINVLYNNPDATLVEKAGAYAELGDWFLMFGRDNAAFNAYSQALSIVADPAQRAEIEQQLFSPLQILPVTEPEMRFEDVNQTEGTLVEVKLDVDQYGLVKHVEVTSLTPEPPDADKFARKVRSILKKNRFRPLLQDGQPVKREGLVTRVRFED